MERDTLVNEHLLLEHPCVCQQFTERVRTVTLLAMDGARMQDVHDMQLFGVPATTTAAPLSVGGNDGLTALGTLTTAPWTTLKRFFGTFETEYETLIVEVCANLPPDCRLAVCTIYQPQLGEAGFHIEGTDCPSSATVHVSVSLVNARVNNFGKQKVAFTWNGRRIECPNTAFIVDTLPNEGDVCLCVGFARAWDGDGKFNPKRCFLQVNGFLFQINRSRPP